MKKLLLMFIMTAASVSFSRAQASAIDPRITKHFTAEQIQEMQTTAPGKIQYLTIYYNSSYIFHNAATATPVPPMEIDVTPFEHLRQQDKRVSVGYSREGHVIELLSRKELDVLYKQIK